MSHTIDLWDVMNTTYIPLSSVLVLVLCIVLVNVYFMLQPRRSRGDRGMSDENEKRLEREKKRIAVCDAFGTALLDLWAENVITRDDHNYYCKVLGEQLGFTDLLRRGSAHSLHPQHLKRKLEILKKTITNRRNGKVTTESPSTTPPDVVSLSERLRIVAGK